MTVRAGVSQTGWPGGPTETFAGDPGLPGQQHRAHDRDQVLVDDATGNAWVLAV